MDQKRALAALGALAQETRLELFRLLVARGPEGLAAGVIADKLAVMPSSLSFHLQQLVHAGLITQRRLSRQLIFRRVRRDERADGLPDRELLRPRWLRPCIQSCRCLCRRRE